MRLEKVKQLRFQALDVEEVRREEVPAVAAVDKTAIILLEQLEAPRKSRWGSRQGRNVVANFSEQKLKVEGMLK